MAKTSRALYQANSKLTAVKVAPEEWADLFHASLLDGHLSALELGAQRAGNKKWTKTGAPPKGYYAVDDWQEPDGTWRQGLMAVARGKADEETQFLHGYTDPDGGDHRGFLNDLKEHDPRYWDEESGSWRKGSLDSRTDLYVGKMRGSANESFVETSPEESLFTWALGPTEHCPDCVEYASMLVDRPKDEFFAYPGAGDSVCLGNCGCRVVRSDGVESYGHHSRDEETPDAKDEPKSYAKSK
jgi:hypothetical protein